MKHAYQPDRHPVSAFFLSPAFSRQQQGASLFELIAGLSITGLLSGLVVGVFTSVGNTSAVTEINNLVADLYYSRSESLKRRTTVTICRSEDQQTCSKGKAWEKGWIVFTDRNRNRVIDGNDRKLLVRDDFDEAANLTLGSGYYYYIMFAPTGEAYPRNTFKYCRPGYSPRAIILFSTGRARISDKDSSGKPLNC